MLMVLVLMLEDDMAVMAKENEMPQSRERGMESDKTDIGSWVITWDLSGNNGGVFTLLLQKKKN